MANTKRLDYLDSIRGLAALIVLLGHCFASNGGLGPEIGGIATAFSSPPDFLRYVVAKLMPGRSSVIIFFILSGFVLALSLERRPLSYSAFVIKRFFRIYPAFVVVVLSSYILHRLVGVPNDVGSQFLRDEVINPNLSAISLIKHLALWGTRDGIGLDCVIWSLVPEMRVSLLFPLILISLRKYGWRAFAIYAVVSVASTALSFLTTGKISTGSVETTTLGSILVSGFFIVFFAAGALLCIERKRVALAIARLPRWKKILSFIVVAVLIIKSSRNFESLTGIPADYINGFGAAGLIALALGIHKFQKVLSHRVPIWLGRISYSLYLVHIPIIYLVNQTFGATWSAGPKSVAVVCLSFLTAELMARLIEFPSLALGKKVCQPRATPVAV